MEIEIPLWKGKTITLGTPHRVEMILLFFYVTFFLWFDVLQNKVLDKGILYEVHWFGSVTSSALDLAVVLLILFHLTLMGLFLMSLRSKATHRNFDIIIGTLAFFGVAMVLSGFINDIYAETIRFLFVDMASVTFYHIGVGLEMLAGLYWAITK